MTELQYQQVLSNLAMLSLDPYAIPAHINLRDGSSQISDVGAATSGAELTFTSKALPSITGSRTVVEQWGVTPVTDKTELKLMRIAYRRALGHPDLLEDSLADDLAHELCKQISQSDDIDLRSDPTINTEALRSDRLIEQAAILNAFSRQAEKEPLPLPSQNRSPQPLPRNDDTNSRNLYYLNNFYDNKDLVLNIAQLADALGYAKIASNDENIIFPGELEQGLDINNYFYLLPSGEYLPITASPITREARRQVKECYKDILEIQSGWFNTGNKHEVPRDAIYVSRYRDRYAWVCPSGTESLSEFTLKMLDLSSIIKDQAILSVPGGPRFTPSTGIR